MRKSELPVGSVAALKSYRPGHDILIVKGNAGWRYVETGELVDYDTEHKATWDLVSKPGQYRPHQVVSCDDPQCYTCNPVVG